MNTPTRPTLPSSCQLPARLLASLTVMVLLLLATAPTAQATVRDWDGGHGNWNVASNWSPVGVPVDGDELRFLNSGLNYNTTNNMTGLNLAKITIDAGIDLYGNAVGVSSEIFVFTSHPLAPATRVYMDITLDADVTITAYPNTSFNSVLTFYGDIATGSHTLRVGDSGLLASAPVHLSGSVTGSGSVVKFGDGTVYLDGSVGNSFAGSTTVEEGLLILNKSSGNAVPNDAIIGGNGTGDPAATLQQNASFQIGDDVTINRMGTYDLNGYLETILDLNLNGGADFDSGASVLTVAGDVTVDGGVSTLSGGLGLTSGTHYFNILFDGLIIWPGAHCYLNSVVTGSGNLVKTGPGVMSISGNNTYTGTTTVQDGSVMVEANTALGTTAGGTTVQSGATLYISAMSAFTSRHIGNEALSLGGSLQCGGTSNSWAGDIVLTGSTEMDVYGNYLNLTGEISGTGGVTKEGGGALLFSGSTPNTYSGATAVNNGSLLLGKTAPSPFYAIGFGSLTVGDGVGSSGTAIAKELVQYQLGTIPITVNGDGLLDLNNFYDTVGNSLTLNQGGDVQTGASGTLALGSSSQITVNASSGSSVITGHMTVGGGACTFDILDGALYVSARVGGSADITKTGPGTLYLQSSNDFTGTLTVDQYYLAITDPWALGSAAAGTIVNNAAILGLVGTITVESEPLTMNSSYTSGAIFNPNGSNVWAGPITLLQDTSAWMSGGHILNITGSIDGAGGLTKVGDGTLILSGSNPNTYTGDTIVNRGTLELDKSSYNVSIPGNLYIGDGSGGADADVVRLQTTSQIPSTSRVTIRSSGFFDMNNLTEYFGSLEGSGHVNLGSGNMAVEDGSSTTYSGQIEGSGELRKYGAGTLTLTGNNTYTGITRVYAGTLLANGSQISSDVTVSSPATLGGTGTVGAISSSGNVAPGTSPGQLVSNGATLQSGSTFDVELNGPTLNNYDQLAVHGSIVLNNPNLALTVGYLPSVGDEFTIIDNGGGSPVTGTFNGLPDGATLVVDNVTFKITYDGGGGDHVVLVVADVVPVEDLQITSIHTVGSTVYLQWTGGLPAYVVERKTAVTNATWTPITGSTIATATNVPMTSPEAFYRISGGH